VTYALGLDLGGTNLKGALVERDDGLVASASLPTEADGGPDHVVARMAALAARLLDDANLGGADLGGAAVAGLGIGSPGTVSWDRTTVTQPPNLPGWDRVDLRERLRAHLGERLGEGLHVVVENDANVAALGSAYYGAGQAFDAFLMATLGTGVGGAIVYDGTLFRGATGGAGELGHLSIDYEGPLTNYGIAGSVEAYLGQQFLSRYARLRLANHPDSLVHDRLGGDLDALTPRTLYEAARDGDDPARAILAWAGHKLGCALASAVNLLDIRAVVVGGGVSAAGAFLLDPAREALRRRVIPGFRDGLTLVREEQGNTVALLGAARLAFDTAAG
jgi:glucokinase